MLTNTSNLSQVLLPIEEITANGNEMVFYVTPCYAHIATLNHHSSNGTNLRSPAATLICLPCFTFLILTGKMNQECARSLYVAEWGRKRSV